MQSNLCLSFFSITHYLKNEFKQKVKVPDLPLFHTQVKLQPNSGKGKFG